jgi:hypothetical protein
MTLDVEAIAQAQMAKLVLAQGACQETARLIAKLRNAFVHQRFVDCVIPIHNGTIRLAPPAPPITGKHELMTAGPSETRRAAPLGPLTAGVACQNRDLLGRGNFRLRATS